MAEHDQVDFHRELSNQGRSANPYATHTVKGLLARYMQQPSEGQRGILADSLEELGHPASGHLRDLPSLARLASQWGNRISGTSSYTPWEHNVPGLQQHEVGQSGSTGKYWNNFIKDVVFAPQNYDLTTTAENPYPRPKNRLIGRPRRVSFRNPNDVHFQRLRRRVRAAVRRLAVNPVTGKVSVPNQLSTASPQEWLGKNLIFPHERRHVANMANLPQTLAYLPPVQELIDLAVAGRANADWYPEKQGYHKLSFKNSPDPRDYYRHQGLSAAFSANGPVEGAENATQAAMSVWMSGAQNGKEIIPPRSKDPAQVKRLMLGLFRGDKLKYLPTDPLMPGKPISSRHGEGVAFHTSGDPKDEQGFPKPRFTIGRAIYEGAHLAHVVRALTEPEHLMNLSQPHLFGTVDPVKVNSYYHNGMGNSQYVTTDTHHKRIMGIGQGKKSISPGEFAVSSALTRHGASLMSQGEEYNPHHDHPRFGGNVTPSSFQARVWAPGRAATEMSAQNEHKGKSVDELIRDMKNRDVYEHSNFTRILQGSPMFRAISHDMISRGHLPDDFFHQLEMNRVRYQPSKADLNEPAVKDPSSIRNQVNKAFDMSRKRSPEAVQQMISRRQAKQTGPSSRTSYLTPEQQQKAGPAWWEQPEKLSRLRRILKRKMNHARRYSRP